MSSASSAAAAVSASGATATGAVASIASGLSSWHSSPSRHLLLDARSPSSFFSQRLRVSTNVPWCQFEASWSQLPAQVIPFAILLPNEQQLQQQDEERREKIKQNHATKNGGDRPHEQATVGKKKNAPLGPSSPDFVPTHASLVELLRSYHWSIPSEWIFIDSPDLWSAASDIGLLVDGPNDPIEQHLLFQPSPYLLKHSNTIKQGVEEAERRRTRRDKQGDDTTSGVASPAKQPRLDGALCVSNGSSDSSSSPPFSCLDIGCGSGRDLGWFLRSSPLWHGTGIDVSSDLLSRAHGLATTLGVEQRLATHVARINQATGEWRVGEEKITPPKSKKQRQADGGDGVGGGDGDGDGASASTPANASGLSGAAQRRENRRLKDALAAAKAAAAVNVSVPFLTREYDLILMVRFLSRAFFRLHLNRLLKPGGYFLLSTFIDEDGYVFESPLNPEFRIAGTSEVEKWAREAGLEVIVNQIGRCEDGRPISECLLRKPIQGENNNNTHNEQETTNTNTTTTTTTATTTTADHAMVQ